MDFSGIKEGQASEPGNESDEEKLVFHYSREERLKNAPELVQKYYSGELLTTKRGLFRALLFLAREKSKRRRNQNQEYALFHLLPRHFLIEIFLD